MPEELYPLKRPRADDMTQQFAWVAALKDYRDAAPDLFARLLPHPPEPDDLIAWLDLGKVFARLHRELAAETLDCDRVAALCRELGVVEEGERWDVLADLERGYLRRLDALDLWDIQTARLFALENEEPRRCPPHTKEIVLIGTVDLNRTQKRLLEMIAERVRILVFAPESERERFDAFGCVLPERWADELRIDIPEKAIRAESTAADQATAVLRWMSRLAGCSTPPASDEITIGVPDEEVVPHLEEQMRQCDLKARYGGGTPMNTTSVYRLLEAMARFPEGRRFDDFAALIRHPVFASFCCHDGKRIHNGAPNGETPTNQEPVSCDLLTELDIYRTTFMPLTVPRRDEDWHRKTDERHPHSRHDFNALRVFAATLDDYLDDYLSSPGGETAASPRIRCEGLWNLMKTLFSGSMRKKDRLVREGLGVLEETLRNIQAVPDAVVASVVPTSRSRTSLSSTTMMELVLRQLDSLRIPPENDRESIELLGWLELAMDDSAAIAITGMNEGKISASLSSDMFLPNRIRRHLGLEDNERRHARDAYALSVIMNSRKSRDDGRGVDNGCRADAGCSGNDGFHGGMRDEDRILLVSGRRSSEGNALLPSRLFFACDRETIARRACRFFGDTDADSGADTDGGVMPPVVVFPGSIRPGHANGEAAFVPPELPRPTNPPDSMRVTEFRDYLACPYRYFLKHRLHLESLDDRAEELDALAFGALVHEVLDAFARDENIVGATNADVVSDRLDRELDRIVLARYGPSPRTVVEIQVEQIRYRLRAFARWQAAWTECGNVIIQTEYPFDIPFDVDGTPIRLKGRIDRIDYNPRTETYVVFDYKTSDTGPTPEKVHRAGTPKRWVDLQLPLYREALGFRMPQIVGKTVRLGYVNLPKDIAKTKEESAEWTDEELREAVATARQVVRHVRAGHFEPNPNPPKYADAFAAICLDNQFRLM
ncbi:MAG TPA: hypothetical protein DEB39_00340 [Planctomycetaceae bacterium]|nr:hypothetical protein [Planctomycetaceae bacterium]